MHNAPNNMPVWSRDREKSMRNRIQKIQTLNDPTTSVDEILFYAKIILYVLLAYSAMLGYFCYYKNFSQSFPFYAAVFMSLALPLAIEFGKNYCVTWAIRKPFFSGFAPLFARWSSLIMFVALAAVGVATFIMSIRNSTTGAHQLSSMLSHERNASVFTPDTRTIDDQITATQRSIDDNRGIKWKGTVTYQAQKAIQSQTKALNQLQEQRAAAIHQQRADWEKSQGIKESQGNYVAELVLASGGWTELLQFLLMFLRVACEKSLDNRLPSPTPQPSTQNNGFSQFTPSTGAEHQTFFNRRPNGQVRSALSDPHPLFSDGNHDPFFTVSQSPPAVTQHNGDGSANYADDVLRLAETRIRGFYANFGRKGGKDSTVSENINRILDETLEKMQGPHFQPSRGQAAKFYAYTVDLFRGLNEKGWPYDRQTALGQYALSKIPDRQPADS